MPVPARQNEYFIVSIIVVLNGVPNNGQLSVITLAVPEQLPYDLHMFSVFLQVLMLLVQDQSLEDLLILNVLVMGRL